MEAETTCQLFPVKEEMSEPSLDINPEMIKREPIDDIPEDASRTESVDFDELEVTVKKPFRTYGKMSSALDHQLFPIKSEFMESEALDPLDISQPKLIKRERIDDGHYDFSTGSYALPIDTISTVQPNVFMTKKSTKKQTSKNGKVETDHLSSQVDSNKTQRKDKGKSRLTSYMLWARGKRQQLKSTRPKLDFASISSEIGKMWANVPSNEKYNWKRKAKRFNAKNEDKASSKSAKKTPAPSTQYKDIAFNDYEHDLQFGKIKQKAGEHIASLPFGYNAELNIAESTNYPVEQWTITEVAEARVSSRKRKQKRIEDDDFLWSSGR